MAALRDVFGVHNPPPLLTYVDRAGLDDRIKHFLTTGRHLVLYGPSKQGKTALRKRAMAEDSCVVIQCRNRPTLDQLYSARPVLGNGAYAGPIKGLWMCGAGTHPGGGVTGAPGHNCAREMLRGL